MHDEAPLRSFESPPISTGRHDTEEASLAKVLQREHWRELLKSLFFGQLLSLLLACTGIASSLLADACFKAPMIQNLGNYFVLAILFLPQCFHGRRAEKATDNKDELKKKSNEGQITQSRDRWWLRYFLIALVDIEANFLVVLAFEYTTVTSVMLLDCFTIPCVMVLSFLFLRASYCCAHIVGAIICAIGMGLIIMSDNIGGGGGDNSNSSSTDCHHTSQSSDRVLGDCFALGGAILYAVSNVVQEALVKDQRLGPEGYLGRLGACGSLVGIVQVALMERDRVVAIHWDHVAVAAPLAAYVLVLALIYILTSRFMRDHNAALFNLSLLTSDVYAMLYAYVSGQQTVQWLYLVAFLMTMSGLLVFHYSGGKVQTQSIPARCSIQSFCPFLLPSAVRHSFSQTRHSPLDAN